MVRFSLEHTCIVMWCQGRPYAMDCRKGTLEVDGDTLRYVGVGTLNCYSANCGVPYGELKEERGVENLEVQETSLSYDYKGTHYTIKGLVRL